ncbi:hypothetical protein AMK59_3469 [Oryctes borbonicus]|uniref:Tc1-like transposase DDE domain-containing protein n=1 Tax=Oryctes borbonicus TaxID=1629725 RepID=A0A0T6B8X9_9SCAR|nr:hypothetical protein AMK59_3469 [Oryctes borbonicus]
MELPHIVLKRINFLSEYVRYKKSETYKFVFTDETWIFQDGTVARSWQDDDVRSVRTRKVDGKRLIVLLAGNSDGFIDGAGLVFPSATATGDYHGEMNRANYL